MKNFTKISIISFTFYFSFFTFRPLYAADMPSGLSNQVEIVEKGVERDADQQMQEKPKKAVIQEEERPEPVAAEGELKFFVKKIELEGNTAIASAELEALIKPYENKEVSMTGLGRLTKAIERLYRQKGYITAYVYVPPQRVEDETVTIQIIEGKVGKQIVENNRFFRKKRILEYSELKKGEILRYKKLRDTLNQMNQNPDRQVKAILRGGEEPQTTDIIYDVRDHFPIHAGFSYDNQGVDTSGKQRFGFTLRDNNTLTLDDILLGGVIFGSHFGAVFTQYLLPLPSLGAKFLGGFTHTQVSPKGVLKPFGVNGTAETYTLRIEKAIWNGQLGPLSVIANLNFGFDFKESRTKVLAGTFQRTRLRIIYFEPAFQIQDRWGFTTLFSNFSFGINGLGAAIFADPGAARQGVEPSFFKWKTGAFRQQRLPWGTRAGLRLEFQLPSTKLAAQEQFYLGGAATIRGYPEGDYLADTGFLASFEYLIPCFVIPESWQLPHSDIPLRKQIDIVAFVDEGYGRLRGASNFETIDRNLLGVGGGLRTRVYKDLFARTEWAVALGDHPLTDNNRYRFHFRLQYEV